MCGNKSRKKEIKNTHASAANWLHIKNEILISVNANIAKTKQREK